VPNPAVGITTFFITPIATSYKVVFNVYYTKIGKKRQELFFFGFTDVIAKTGDLLFSSLLYYESALKIVSLYKRIDEPKPAQIFELEAKKIADNIEYLWNPEVCLYNAASYDCCQSDVWGSAYAVYIGIVDEKKGRLISESLIKNWDRIVKRGQIRHISVPTTWEKLLTDAKEYRYSIRGRSTRWLIDRCAPGMYQNGAYLATPVGWIAQAVRKVNPRLANQLLSDLIADFKKNGVWECINDDYQKDEGYVLSTTMPLSGFDKKDTNL